MLLITREIKVSCRVLDDEKMECEFTAATETPVDMGDPEPQVLRMSGATLGTDSMPFLNAHSRKSVLDVLGRTVFRKDDATRTLAARVKFSKATEQSRAAWELVKDGSINAVSVGYYVDAYRTLRDGEEDVEAGDERSRVKGPATVVTKWRPVELSLVPLGADPNAVKRALASAVKEEPVRPKPNPGETKDQFLARAMADAALLAAIPDESKRRAEADRIWTEAQPKTPAPAAPPSPAPSPAPAGRHLDEELALELEARKKLILSRCPVDLREYLDELLLREPTIEPAAAWKKLLEERTRRLPPGGTPEPRKPGANPSAPPAAPAPTQAPAPEEPNEVLRFMREVR